MMGKHTLEPISDPVMMFRRRVVEHCAGLAGKCRPEISRIRVGIEKAGEIDLDTVQGFLELSASDHAGRLWAPNLTG
jgi:hypothetical protein